jgi:hypothetical protein
LPAHRRPSLKHRIPHCLHDAVLRLGGQPGKYL